MVPVEKVLEIGIRHQRAGELAEAERLYRQILDVQPHHADALHLMGILDTEAGRLDEAIEHLTLAIRMNGSRAAFHINLGEAYRRAGKMDQAIQSNLRAAELQPTLPAVQSNLGQLYRNQGDLEQAADRFRELVRLRPNDARARKLLAAVLLDQDKLDESEPEFRRALELAPHDSRAHYDLGVVLQSRGKLEEAADQYRAALEGNLGDAQAHNNLGVVLQRLNRLAEAESHYRRAIELEPTYGTAHNNLGLLLTECLRCEEAIEFLHKAIEMTPDDPSPHTSLGSVLQGIGWIDDSIAATRRSIELDPNSAAPYNNLGVCYQTQGRLDEAYELFRKAMELDPEHARNHSNYIYALNYHSAYDSQTLFAEHRKWGKMHADPLTADSAPHANDRTPGRRLRIGYVSAHFRQHAVNFFTEPILASHDHEQVEVFCYSNSTFGDEVTQRLKSHVDHWREIVHENDKQVCQWIRADQIDILVDLSGHISGERLLVFARKPAPVQVTYIGYQNTTGMQAMDYRLTDAWADPPGQTDPFYTEKLVRLPRAYFCYRPSPDAPPVGPLPALANGYVTFGSFNNFSKITPQVLESWAELMDAVPRSRLVLLCIETPELRERVVGILAKNGVDSSRVDFELKRPRLEYLDLISRVDIALDPFPFNGHTTTCDALWQGVPVLSLAGDAYASRFGTSAHVNLGLEEWIASSREEYVRIGARLAGDLDRLAALRAALRERMAASPVLDFTGFTRNLEAAYRQMWTEWCARQPA